LDLVMIDGFAFMTGQTFDVLNYTRLTGDLGFDGVSFFGHACSSTSTDVWTCGRGPIFEELFGSSSLDLDVLRGVPEPSTWGLLATGFLASAASWVVDGGCRGPAPQHSLDVDASQADWVLTRRRPDPQPLSPDPRWTRDRASRRARVP
jgi:hypothetical protein